MADNKAYQAKLAQLEIKLQALEFLELRTMITVSEGKAPGPESSILKLMGTQAQQGIAELTMDSAGYFASPWGKPVGLKFGKGATNKYLDGRASTIYGGASEVQRDVIAKRVLGL
jgi:alkylation response protein AidB-like acyl-CoA dehydrogenase